ncbi:Glyoxylase, beta-lactamase superfamily II [Chryseobacterium arachidis]|uniref:Glyoxylase, beta-lactamase superfamily II n=1 Tax=Chryseobacterium arachidis TaxID=1416778 RepID=A0A1M5HVG1_9FLAO|nr:MBL fold metallo-hydrolase [Chryseobacterium arachidis]SHG19935.1 Glyoxylase, beta-lactamase superfamily II [Chryseobacterium arachidis]
MNTTKDIKNSGFFKFQLGQMDLAVITDGVINIESVHPMFAPNIEKEDIQSFFSDNMLNEDKLELAGNILLIKNGEKNILIDTGSGVKLSPSTGKLIQNLKNLGISPLDITDVVFTHAHPDHIGGVVDKHGRLVFGNADYYISETEYNFWMSDEPDFSKGTQNQFSDFEIQFARDHFKPIEGRLNLYSDEAELFGFLQLEHAPGHTPGHTIITISSEGEELVHIADTFQHIMLVQHPEWGNQIDSNFEQGIKTRKDILEKLSSTKKLFFGDHLPYPGLGFIQKTEKGYHYVPKAFYTV